jgi:FkbM family methyltransferase
MNKLLQQQKLILPTISKLKSYFIALYYKLISPLECKNYKLKVFTNEIIFLFHSLSKYRWLKPKKEEIFILNTKLGKYQIRNVPFDIEVASPAFERADLNTLSFFIKRSLVKNKKVIFIDVGAGLGKYSIAISTIFKKYKSRIEIYSFEPDPKVFLLLKNNVRLNKLSNIKIFNTALSNKKSLKRFYYYAPMKMIVSFKTEKIIYVKCALLDEYFKNTNLGDNVELFIKLDVEGHEMEVLDGARKTISKSQKTILLIEDVFNISKLRKYLLIKGKFVGRNSMQNSFWSIK